MNSLEPLIVTRGLAYEYPSQKTLLRLPDFELKPGQKLLIYGESGTGKSTLLHIVSGLLKNYKGSIRFMGKELSSLSDSEADRLRFKAMGNIYQSLNLIPYLNVLENVILPTQFLGTPVKDKARELLKRMGLADLETRNVSELSVGQQQRVAAARAMVHEPKLILADEPTSALDRKNSNAFIETLFSLCDHNKTALLMVSHDEALQKLFSERVELTVPVPNERGVLL